ncbi:hypothetical protein [Veronia pacifica]|uniref:Uncharacterized protein n=1 Tax=Veronia pacifica TaxID=1080227 RepID=A0A1C3EMS9_9GAMM|nr:hypothetical protein [Veronia pacifica]ODA34538.1 hypothetical protein A8L45_06095 [Veronia pacifica]
MTIGTIVNIGSKLIGGLFGGGDNGMAAAAQGGDKPAGGNANAAVGDHRNEMQAHRTMAKTQQGGGGGFLGGIFDKIGGFFKNIAQTAVKALSGALGLGGVFEKTQDVWNVPSAQNAGELAIEGGQAALPILNKIIPGIGGIGQKLLDFGGKLVGDVLSPQPSKFVGGFVDTLKGIPIIGKIADFFLGN